MKKKQAETQDTKSVPRRVTLASRVSVEMEERRSVFIGHAAPVADEEEARRFLEEIRHRYADATHNVYAYLLSDGVTARYSDDGEPHGTAGMPVLQILKQSGAMDLAVVVTRYFGGILLGAGGLVRAYAAAAKLAIDQAGLAVLSPWDIVSFSCSYTAYQKITAGLPKTDAIEENADFAELVQVTAAVPAEKTETLRRYLTEATAGKCALSVLRTEERAAPAVDSRQ